MPTSYVPPIVEVFQEFKAAGVPVASPLLTGVVVGPSYHILTYARDKDSIFVADYNKVTGNTFFAPSALPGMKLSALNLAVYIDDATVEMDTQVDGVFTFGNVALSDIVTSATADYVTSEVAVGDDVALSDGVDTFVYKVLEVVDLNTLRLNKNIEFTASKTGLSVDVTRFVNDKEVASSHYTVDLGLNQVTLNIGVTVTEGNGLKTVLSGKLYLEYKALDVTHAFVPVEISENDEIEAKLGTLSGDDNPLAMGAFVQFSNSQRKTFALALESDDLIGWGKAVSIIKKRKIYVKALLTKDPAIISLFKVLEIANADSKVADFGLSIGTHKVEELEQLQVLSSLTGATLNDPVSTLDIIFQDNSADFLNSDVQPGDQINITGALATGNPYIVDSIINSNKLKIITTPPFGSLATGLTYTIDRLLDEEQLAARIAAVSQSYAEKRVIMVFPDFVGIAGEKLPGYYAACAVAGMISGLPANAGITNKGIAVIEKVYNSNFRFDEPQLNTIAGGGTLVFIQDDESSLPYVRHQLTTDMTTLKTSEISAIKNNDYVSFTLRAIIRKFLGKFNVQEGLFLTLRPALQGVIDTLEKNVSTELGPILIEGNILELKQSATNADQVEAVIDTVQPAPFNRGILRILA